MKIGQYTYRYGQAVAILVDHVIRFGNVEKVITQSTKGGESTAIQVAIEKGTPENPAEPERFLVARADLIESASAHVYGTHRKLFERSEEWKTAIQFQERVDNPPAEVSPPAAEAPIQGEHGPGSEEAAAPQAEAAPPAAEAKPAYPRHDDPI